MKLVDFPRPKSSVAQTRDMTETLTGTRRTPVIIDTDPGVDDIIAILLAIASPEIEIIGFIVSFGNTDRDAAYLNIFKAFEIITQHIERFPKDKDRFPNLYNNKKPFLAFGAAEPLEGDIHSAQYFHGRDGLGDIACRHPEIGFQVVDGKPYHPHLNVVNRLALDMTLESIDYYPQHSITYIVLGPMTNLALVLHHERSNAFRENIGCVIAMGGALDVPGNTSPVAEFNFFADPFAVKEVLDNNQGLALERFILLPLDITTPHQLKFPMYKEVVDPYFKNTSKPSNWLEKSPIVHFTSSFLERTREIMISFGNDAVELHDIVAVWCAIANPPTVCRKSGELPTLAPKWKAAHRKFEIERYGELTRGMLVLDRREDQSAYALGENRALVQEEILRSGILPAPLESNAIPAEVEVQDKPTTRKHPHGVACITETPGCDEITQLLLQRVWGLSKQVEEKTAASA